MEELYKISSDVAQINNLAEDKTYRKVKNELKETLTNHLKVTGDPRMNNKDPWQKYLYQKVENINNSLKHEQKKRKNFISSKSVNSNVVNKTKNNIKQLI